MAKLKSAIISTVGWLVLAIPFYGGLYACSVWLMPKAIRNGGRVS
jgi:hypothetical protein